MARCLEVVGVEFTELWVSLDPEVEYDPAVARIQEVVDGYPGLFRDVLTYLRERIKEVLTGASATIVVRTFGPELDGLRSAAERVAASIAAVPGVIDLKVEPQVLVPHLEIRLRPEAAAQFGLTPADVRGAVTTLVRGAKVGEFYEGQAVFDVFVIGVPGLRESPEHLTELYIDTPAGIQVPLGHVAEVAIVPTPNMVKRENASRRIDVTCNVRGRDLGSVARDVEARVEAAGP